MKPEEVLKQLESLGNEKTRAMNTKQGAGDNQYGVKLGDIRKLAKKIKTNHELALSLWETGNVDARFLSILIISLKDLSADQIDQMVRSIEFVRVADWFNSYVINRSPDRESLRQRWMNDAHPMAARSGWSITAERVVKDSDGMDLGGILDRIESEMADSAPEVQWTMNMALAYIGVHFPKHRKRAIAIGEELGMYRDYPVSKGCTSPYAPIWIEEVVRKQAAS